ncbi:PDR/VanB family oxidoreductase [Pantoea vagans]|uniref:PDR/VanB family oxidoreductase n=1 Tax=Pantoea vagans TaxID=470934 RepID=UPI0030163AB3
MAFQTINVTVSSVKAVTEDIREVRLSSSEGQSLPEYGPGAHTMLFLRDAEGTLLVRHYSLIGGDTQDDPRNVWRIAVKREQFGQTSNYIHTQLKPGMNVQVSVPVNAFPLERTNAPTLLIAGGIGITPILSMLRSLVKRSKAVRMIYCGLNPQSMAYHNEVKTLTDNQAQCLYAEDKQRLQFGQLFSDLPPETHIYICGPLPMIEACISAAKQCNWPLQQLHYELFLANNPLRDSFDVYLKKSAKTIHVHGNTSILDALNNANIDVLWDCRRGECGVCTQHVIDADGPIIHRDVCLDDDDKNKSASMCICVSRLKGKKITLDL